MSLKLSQIFVSDFEVCRCFASISLVIVDYACVLYLTTRLSSYSAVILNINEQ